MITYANCRPAGASNRDGAKDRPIITRLNLGTILHINTKFIANAIIPAPARNGDITPGGGDIHPGATNIHANKISCLLNAIVGIQHDVAGGGCDVCGDTDGAAGQANLTITFGFDCAINIQSIGPTSG